jgi:hypothetical protein
MHLQGPQAKAPPEASAEGHDCRIHVSRSSTADIAMKEVQGVGRDALLRGDLRSWWSCSLTPRGCSPVGRGLNP